ncbi:MFS transporter [Alkalibacillus salilacus]|uniref:MFS family arabinose efflux permease n=1 Tax=Alkalibacillus salilacus TaxID=284582 RepID=A0ABT9VDH7_9BACI|nr:MFS transporter [Alkalibacillus salilacus]MDQ0158895.1 putative MFS family arabinose efflux permease [Alkalibacillus salilacus]
MRFSQLVLPGVTMIAVTYGLARFSFGLLLPDINSTLNMSEFTSGLISSLFYLAYCFTIIYSTVLTTRDGPRKMILLAGAAAVVGLMIITMTPNAWVLGFGVLLAGSSTGLISPPYGAAISLWINRAEQGKANTWINSGTSLGIILSGLGAIVLSPNWRITYLIYAILTLLVLIWNYRVIPKTERTSFFQIGELSIKGVKGAIPLIIASLILGVSTAAFWTFSRTFIEIAGNYPDWQLSLFWVMIGIFGILGGFSGSMIETIGLPTAYKVGGVVLASGSIILALFPTNGVMAIASAGIFGAAYIFISGVLLVWGIKVFITNASLGIGIPFLLLALGQVFGSTLAGTWISLWSYSVTFIISGMIGLIAILIGPKQTVTHEQIREDQQQV